MLNCLNTPGNVAGNGTDMSVLERRRVRLKWQQEQAPLQGLFSDNDLSFFTLPSQALEFPGLIGGCGGGESGLGELVTRSAAKADPGTETGWPELGKYAEVMNGDVYGMNHAICRTASCLPIAAAVTARRTALLTADGTDEGGRDSASSEKLALGVGKERLGKRKADNKPKDVIAEDETIEKRRKGCTGDGDGDGESKITEQKSNRNNNSNIETSADTSKDNSKASEVHQKPDYIHVRARRGQATDSHSLAERVRRERISERMKYLQDLVPGCNKITGKAGMLDEIINYVQSLQHQVEFLSMKLAAVNPRLDFDIDSFFAKEVMPTCAANFHTIGISPPDIANPTYPQYNTMQQEACSGFEMGVSPELGFRRTINTPLPIPSAFIDTSCFTQIQATSTWDAELQNLYGGDTQGSVEAGNLKMEM